MHAFLKKYQDELISDIDNPLETILRTSSGTQYQTVKNCILKTVKCNQELHHSRTAYVNHFKNQIIKNKNGNLIKLNYLNLLATLNEALIHDIDNRLDGHSVDILDSCFLQAYAPLLMQQALIHFSNFKRAIPLASDFYLKRLTKIIMNEQFIFLDQINSIPIIENRIARKQSQNPSQDLKKLLKIRCFQTTISATLIFLPILLLKKINDNTYQKILKFFMAVHIVDGLLKDYEEMDDDNLNGRFNTWLELKDSPPDCRTSYAEFVKESLCPLDAFSKKEYTCLDEYLKHLTDSRSTLLKYLNNISKN